MAEGDENWETNSLKKMTIRKMTIEDYDNVYQLWITCVGMGLNNLDDSRKGIDKYLKKNPDTCFVAEENDEVIGAILAGHDGRRGFIYHTAVIPDYRKQGIASKLVECAMDALMLEGINKVALVVFDRNEAGNVFWEKLGFTSRNDLIYRNKEIMRQVRIDT